MPTVRIVRFHGTTAHREVFRFTLSKRLLDWWEREKNKNKHHYYIVHSFPCPPMSVKDKPEDHDWCPYCQDWVHFATFDDLERCEVCRVSEHEYYVRKYNYRLADKNGEIEHGGN